MSTVSLLAVSITIGTPDSARIARHTSMPFMPGSIRSSSTTSGRSSRTAGSARVPSATTAVSNPSPRSTMVSISASAGSSSTTRTRDFMDHSIPLAGQRPRVGPPERPAAVSRGAGPPARPRRRRSTAVLHGASQACGGQLGVHLLGALLQPGVGLERVALPARLGALPVRRPGRGHRARRRKQQLVVRHRDAEPVDLQGAHPGHELPRGVLVQPGRAVGGVRRHVAVHQHASWLASAARRRARRPGGPARTAAPSRAPTTRGRPSARRARRGPVRRGCRRRSGGRPAARRPAAPSSAPSRSASVRLPAPSSPSMTISRPTGAILPATASCRSGGSSPDDRARTTLSAHGRVSDRVRTRSQVAAKPGCSGSAPARRPAPSAPRGSPG